MNLLDIQSIIRHLILIMVVVPSVGRENPGVRKGGCFTLLMTTTSTAKTAIVVGHH